MPDRLTKVARRDHDGRRRLYPLAVLTLAVIFLAATSTGCETPTVPVPVQMTTPVTQQPVKPTPAVVPVQREAAYLLTPGKPDPVEEDLFQRCGVKYEAVDGSEYEGRLMTMIASGSPPDIIQVYTNSFVSLARQGMLMPVGGSKWISLGDFEKAAVEAFSFGGQTYGVPREVNPLVLFYNRDLFDKVNAKYPTDDWTWNDLGEAAKEIWSKAGKAGFAVPVSAPQLAAFIFQNGAGIIAEDFSDTWLDKQEAMDAGQFYASLAAKEPGLPTDTLQTQRELFVKGEVAMMLDTYSAERDYLANFQYRPNYGAVQPPAGPAREGTVLFSMAYAVPSNSPRPDTALQAIACLTSESSQDQVLEAGIALPARYSIAKHWYLEKNPVAGTAFRAAELPTLPYNWGPRHADVEKLVEGAIKDVVFGGVTVNDSFKTAAAKIRDLLRAAGTG